MKCSVVECGQQVCQLYTGGGEVHGGVAWRGEASQCVELAEEG